MSITKRVAQLMKADVHGVLDILEEPAAIIRQSIREMSDEISRQEEECRACEFQLKENARAQLECDSLHQELQRQVQLCITEANDELARAVIRRKLEVERRLAALVAKHTSLLAVRDQNMQQLEERRRLLQQIKERYELAQSIGEMPVNNGRNVGGSISDAEVEIALLQEKSRTAAAVASK